jgi:hypothetical protein
MKQKIKIDKPLTFEELQAEIKNNSRFVVFQYCISIMFAVTLRRFSPAILISPNSSISKYKRRYDFITILFGWWGFPWGPIHSMRSLNINRKGGLDVTNDIMLNISKDDLIRNEVDLKLTNELFCKPDKWDAKSFKIAIHKDFEFDYNIKQLVIGLFVNTEKGIAPHYTIGLKVDKNFEDYIELVKRSLYTEFSKHTCFEFVDLNEDNEIFRKLEIQGEHIINR